MELTAQNLLPGTWSVHAFIQSHCLLCSPLSKLALGYFGLSTHLIYHHFVAGQSYHKALELFGIAGPESPFLNGKVRQEMSGERIALWVRQLSVPLAKQISSLLLTKSFL